MRLLDVIDPLASESFCSYPIDFNVPGKGVSPYLRCHQASSYQRIEDARL